MTKTITPILVALFAIACSGEPFTGDAFTEIPPDVDAAGAPDVAGSSSAGSAGVSRGGSTSAGGSSVSVAGKPAAGSASDGGAAGAPTDACEFDAAAVTAALPKAFTWKDFSMASGNVCASCAYEPCSKLAVSWGKPTEQGTTVTYKPAYSPNATVPALVHVAKNDGQCAGGAQCEVKPENVTVALSVARKGAAWEVTEATANVTFADDECTLAFGDPHEMTGPLALDLQQEIRSSLIGLKIPCN